MNSMIMQAISHRKQRYDTAGDWQFCTGNIQVQVSDELSRNAKFLVAMHEFIEAYLCLNAGVSQAEVDAFDFMCEDDDPGLSKKAPYHKQHMVATKIEKMLCKELGMDWDKYESEFDRLQYDQAP